jgi:hypothetical protein
MVETCIAMGLAAFTFTMIIMISHQMLNRNRTMTAARHAAWLAGNDRRDNMKDRNGFGQPMRYLNNVNLWNWFFTPGKDNHTVVTYSTDATPYNTADLLVSVGEDAAAGGSADYTHANKKASEKAEGEIGPDVLTKKAAYIVPYRVSYGFASQDAMNSSPLSEDWPFPLWKLDLPYTGETFLEPFLGFSSVAKWDEVADAWQKPEDAFEAIGSILWAALESLWK